MQVWVEFRRVLFRSIRVAQAPSFGFSGGRRDGRRFVSGTVQNRAFLGHCRRKYEGQRSELVRILAPSTAFGSPPPPLRSEERRVGEEGRSRGSAYH